jgi:hypothetical protein
LFTTSDLPSTDELARPDSAAAYLILSGSSQVIAIATVICSVVIYIELTFYD